MRIVRLDIQSVPPTPDSLQIALCPKNQTTRKGIWWDTSPNRRRAIFWPKHWSQLYSSDSRQLAISYHIIHSGTSFAGAERLRKLCAWMRSQRRPQCLRAPCNYRRTFLDFNGGCFRKLSSLPTHRSFRGSHRSPPARNRDLSCRCPPLPGSFAAAPNRRKPAISCSPA